MIQYVENKMNEQGKIRKVLSWCKSFTGCFIGTLVDPLCQILCTGNILQATSSNHEWRLFPEYHRNRQKNNMFANP